MSGATPDQNMSDVTTDAPDTDSLDTDDLDTDGHDTGGLDQVCTGGAELKLPSQPSRGQIPGPGITSYHTMLKWVRACQEGIRVAQIHMLEKWKEKCVCYVCGGYRRCAAVHETIYDLTLLGYSRFFKAPDPNNL